MIKKERLEYIINIAKKKEFIKVSDFLPFVNTDRTTIYRDMKELLVQWNLIQVKKWVYKYKQNPKDYLKIPFFRRPKITYNFDFLGKYIPNSTTFFSKEQLNSLESKIETLWIHTDFYTNNKRLIENILIDLTYSSSFLEWNTYDYLDTEVLVKFNKIAEDKSKDETQMILNHKKVIEYIMYYKNELDYNKKTFFEVHSVLWENLLQKEYLWVVRNKMVEIWGCAYTPLDNGFQLNEQFEQFLNTLKQIKNPFEQSLFILVFIPYFQLFMDINKRTSRMLCNLPFLKNNLPLFSLLWVDPKEYITAILAIYELNDVSLLAWIYVENYLLNINRYT